MQHDAPSLWDGLARGDRRSLAQAFTVIESGDAASISALSRLALDRAGDPYVIGITGPPGVGKSTLTSALISALRALDNTVAVIAVDPSSPFSHGAVLGDRIRMQAHTDDPGVYIRSVASRGHLGGLAEAVPMGIALLGGAKYDVAVIETVGVGQSEVSLVGTADTVVVVLAPGAGDSVQAAKAGIMEIADVFVVNKADLEGADLARRAIRESLKAAAAVHPGRSSWLPPVVSTVAATGVGLDDLVDAIMGHRQSLADGDGLAMRGRERAMGWIQGILITTVSRRLHGAVQSRHRDRIVALAAEVAARAKDPHSAAEEMLHTLADGGVVP